MRARILLASLALLVSACEVEPYCLSCDDGGEGLDAGGEDGAVERLDAAPDAADTSPPDAGRPDGCTEGVESCNDFDDDCDGFVDEGFDLQTNPEHCGACDAFCNFAHAFATCEAGGCVIGDCDVGYSDLDEDEQNGCEYSCLPTDTSDAVCNNRDDDCDGERDEDVDKENDPMNCGVCGRVCSFPHTTAGCAGGVCVLDACDEGFHDLDGNPGNGCEYACTAATPSDEVCNSRDDDCDGTVDEGNPGGGVACGSDEGACAMGTTLCRSGNVICDGEVRATTELCNGVDDDCDGTSDESNPEGGRVCGTSVGRCEVGTEVCTGGSLVCTGSVEGVDEVCNGLDEDCDGVSDEGNPGGGAACGSAEGECSQGAITCVGGALLCAGGQGPRSELCNSADDDCDGSIDELNPEGGALCGTDIGRCQPGNSVCSGGALICVGETTGVDETCNGQDDDCDNSVDEGNPGGGAACGSDVGLCELGTRTCAGGSFICFGGRGAAAEACNTADDDCDGFVDEDFSLQTDVANCGACGNVCALPNATTRCSTGTCQIASCHGGFVDLDANEPGCEYACDFAGGEICNGVDDDCDGVIDEGVTIPSNFCNPNGVCATTQATCAGAMGFVCNYPATFEESETSCDTLDNDCDGFVDEAYPAAQNAESCFNGEGACRRNGVFVCNGTNDGVVCNAAAAGMEADEECNGVDDDCDGSVDERVADDPGTPWRDGVDLSAIATVAVDIGGSVVQVMSYEASRPDASSGNAGTLGTLACSRPNVQPWVNVDWDTAQQACCALNEDGLCPGGGGSGWRLCDGAEWQVACRGPADACGWSYGASCGMSQPLTCNGAEFDCDPSLPGDQDCRYNTGSSQFPMCFTDWGIEGEIYDMSGNVREWTATPRGTNLFEVRGGSYNHIEAGRSCNWDFTVAQRTSAAPNTGFRCCMY